MKWERLFFFGLVGIAMASGYSLFGWWGIPITAVIVMKAAADHAREVRQGRGE